MGPDGIDLMRQIPVVLASIHIRVGSGMDDHLRPKIMDLVDDLLIRDILFGLFPQNNLFIF
jgi:hypothetical protein